MAVHVDAVSERVVLAFARYEREQRHQAELTVVNGCYVVRQFLAWRASAQRGGLELLGPDDPIGFLINRAGRVNDASLQTTAAVVRIFLRFLFATGRVEVDLSRVVPSVPASRFGRLPQAVDATVIAALLESCDRRRPTGRRDYAVLVLMARLGLRAVEVSRLRLDDIDWRSGEFDVTGKGGRRVRMPLPVDVGSAIADYLRFGRRESASRVVFLSALGPPVGMSRNAVVKVSRHAAVRAGVPMVGAHRLRHSLGTALLRQGASMREVGQVLRHDDSTTTAIYAKVDGGSLVSALRRWPEEVDR
jgi:integrase/recombinase XerD